MSSSTGTGDAETPPTSYSNEELTQLLLDMKIRYANQDKKLSSNQFDLDSFTRKQEAMNRKLEEGIALLLDASLQNRPPDPSCLAELRQTTTVKAYQSAFEDIMQKTTERATDYPRHPLPHMIPPRCPVKPGRDSIPNQPSRFRPRLDKIRAHAPDQTFPWSRSLQLTAQNVHVDDEDDIMESEILPGDEDDGENMVITGDVSCINLISPKLKPRSLHLAGTINNSRVSVLIDGGSTHNFIKPTIAEGLSLPGQVFDIDLFILQVEGPDVILGVQWLQDLGKVSIDFRDLTMEFTWKDRVILLKGDGAPPTRISYNNIFSLMGSEQDCDLFELIPTLPESELPAPMDNYPHPDPRITSILESYGSVFTVPTSLPPSRVWDHRIHLPEEKLRRSTVARVRFSRPNRPGSPQPAPVSPQPSP
ncbi:hypothetical protein SASPL_145367 [Salvia splendens]|uniref:Uncharacterized protein n=1 Tax=Salvia splendens TaxID=180675 RepID=A0A8X8WGZ2_SALSN|nr:hypothetical protein SASPL_145367 [Salvia splendens]